APGGAAGPQGAVASRRRGRDAHGDGARSQGDRGDRGQAHQGRTSPAARGICRPSCGRLGSTGGVAETGRAGGWGVNNALNFPNKHPLCLSMDRASLRRTDLVVGLDVNDWEKQLTELNSAMRTRERLTPPSCDFVEIGFGEINISKWAFDYCRMQSC